MAVTVKGETAPEIGTPVALFAPRILGGSRTLQGYRGQYDVAPDGRFLIIVPVDEEAGSSMTDNLHEPIMGIIGSLRHVHITSGVRRHQARFAAAGGTFRSYRWFCLKGLCPGVRKLKMGRYVSHSFANCAYGHDRMLVGCCAAGLVAVGCVTAGYISEPD